MIRQMAREVYEYRELLLALAWRDIRVKYKQAVMGVMWIFFMPILAILAGIIIRFAMAYLQGSGLSWEAVTSVIARSQPWLIFAAILGTTSQGLLSGMQLASKIYFPRQTIPLASTLGVLFDFVISITAVSLVLVLVSAFAPVGIMFTPWLLMVPVLLSLLVLMAVGLGLVFGTGNLFFRDVKYIVQVMLQFGIFFTPVYWFVHEMGRFGQLMMLNPIAPLIEGISQCVVGHVSEGVGAGAVYMPGMDAAMWPFVIYSAVFAIGSLLAGMAIFRRSEPWFAEVM
ncbi:MAG: ABC transporter permease [Phycisphaeraceae bacterium]|nr:ABC transporter permease [Phycisphaeraceae bacterium]